MDKLIYVTDPETNVEFPRERTMVRTTLAGEIDLIVYHKDPRYANADLYVLNETEALALAHDLLMAAKAIGARDEKGIEEWQTHK